MSSPKPDHRKLPRYITDVKVNFVLPYEIRAEVDFGVERRVLLCHNRPSRGDK